MRDFNACVIAIGAVSQENIDRDVFLDLKQIAFLLFEAGPESINVDVERLLLVYGCSI